MEPDRSVKDRSAKAWAHAAAVGAAAGEAAEAKLARVEDKVEAGVWAAVVRRG
jgi:hypothetical protein